MHFILTGVSINFSTFFKGLAAEYDMFNKWPYKNMTVESVQIKSQEKKASKKYQIDMPDNACMSDAPVLFTDPCLPLTAVQSVLAIP